MCCILICLLVCAFTSTIVFLFLLETDIIISLTSTLLLCIFFCVLPVLHCRHPGLLLLTDGHTIFCIHSNSSLCCAHPDRHWWVCTSVAWGGLKESFISPQPSVKPRAAVFIGQHCTRTGRLWLWLCYWHLSNRGQRISLDCAVLGPVGCDSGYVTDTCQNEGSGFHWTALY